MWTVQLLIFKGKGWTVRWPEHNQNDQGEEIEGAKGEKISAIDVAVQVLSASKEPMNANEMIEAMAAKKLWTSPGALRRMRLFIPR